MSETAAAHLNFGPAWLRDTLTSEAASSSGFNLAPQQPLSKSSSMPSGYMAFPSSSGLATAKLAEFRYGREEMLALYASDHSPPISCQMSALASAGILIERPQLPLNLGGVSEDEQRAWQRGANSESSLKLYKKDSGGLHHAPGMGRGVSTDRIGRGAGRGVGGPRGGPAGVGGVSFFDRHRGIEDDGLDNVGGGVPIGGGVGRGRGVEEGGRSFGRGSSRGFERSISERGGWFERSNSTTDPNEANGGNISPRKGYTRAPFDDWRKPPSGYQDGGEEEGGPSWRGANTASGRRWNAPHGAERGGGNVPPVVGEGRGAAWRNAAPGSEEYRRYGGDREFINGARDEYSERGGGERGGRRGGGGYHNATSSMAKYGRRPRQDSDNLPEWAADESSPLENRGGSFDSAGKFQALSLNMESANRRHPSTQNQSQRDDLDDDLDDDWGERDDGTPPKHRQQQQQQQQRENHHKIVELADEDEEESHFEDEEVDVDDLPTELKRDTLEQREREKASKHISSSTRVDESERDFREDQQQLQQQQQSAEEAVADEKTSGGRLTDEQQQQVHWIYLDPQGNTQGPFNATDMLDWFNAGYFPQDLMLRRTVDRRFIQLGEMTKRYGRIPFMPGAIAPAPVPEVEPPPPVPQPQQLSAEQEEKQRQQQQAALYLKLQQQLVFNQQLMQQHQLFVIQQQQQGASPQALAHAAQQMAEQQKQHQQLLAQLMQLTLLPQQQHHQQQQPQQHGGVLQQQQQAKEFSASPSPLDYASMSSPSPLDLLQQRVHQQQQQQQHANVTAPFELPKQAEQRQQSQQQQQGGLDFAQSFGNTGTGSGYDPIKSLLSQLQENPPHDYPNQSSSPASSLFGNSAGSGSTFSGFGGIPSQQQGSRPGSGHQVPPVANDFSDPVPASHRSIWDLPVSNLREEEPSPEPKVPTNVWMNEGSVSPVHLFSSRQQQQQPEPEPQQHHHKAQLQQLQQQQQFYQQQQQQLQQQEDDEVLSNGVNENYDNDREEVAEGDEFLKPKANEKKDKKVKRAEEKRRQKEAKRAAAAAEAAQADCVPGQGRPQGERNVQQTDEVARPDWGEDGDDAQGRNAAQMEALQRLQEEQRRVLEKEAQAKQQQQQVKLAPWAKRTQHDSGSRDLSLAEIQKLEEEREREARIRREIEEQEMRARQEAEAEQMRRQASKSHNWASAASSNGNHGSNHGSAATKSLAEIQAEEERQERDRVDKERKERKARQKEMGLAQACVWGSATSNLSWATRTATANPPAAAPASNANNQKGQKQQQQQQQQQEVPAWKQQQQGFWDEPTPQQQQQQQNKNVQKQQQQLQQQQQQKGGNRPKKGVKEETKVAAIFRDKQKPQNEFESWCSVSLERLNAEVDIPTFMAFLNDIESPFEVHDYIRNYIGEAKAHKNFAKEYLERRSQWKNSMKARRNFEDDLLTPAAAINPNDSDFLDGPLGGIGASPGGSKSAANRSKKKGGKSKSKDVSHLLAFSVAPSERVNAGELDLPN